MNTKFPFTDRRLAALQPRPDTRYAVQDEKTPGLFLRVTATGHKGFWISRWTGGRRVWQRLGAFPTMDTDAARKACAASLPQLGDARRAHSGNMNRVHELYHLSNPDNQSETTRANRRLFWGKHIAPAIGHMQPENVTPMDIERLKGSMLEQGYSPRTVNEALIILQLLFKAAVRWEYFPDWLPIPTAKIKRVRASQSRTRRLRGDEFARLQAALDAHAAVSRPTTDTPYRQTVVDAIRVMLYTGARSANVKQMRWSQLSMDMTVWTIPASETKTRRDYVIPLVGAVRELLTRRLLDGTGDYVFPGRGCEPHLKSIRSSWTTITEAAGLAGVSLHDLRRTQGSVQAELGVNMAMIGESLGHTSIRSTAVYTRSSGLESIRGNMERAAAVIDGGREAHAPVLTDEQWQKVAAALNDEALTARIRGIVDSHAA